MKRRHLVYIVFLGGMVAIAGIWLGIRQGPGNPGFSPGGQAKQIDVALLRERVGYEFVPAESPVNPVITEPQARAEGNKRFPNLQNVKSVSAELGFLSDSAALEAIRRGENVTPNVSDKTLVWILIYDGIKSVSSGPPGAQRHTTDELDVVISATTGELLFAFTYR